MALMFVHQFDVSSVLPFLCSQYHYFTVCVLIHMLLPLSPSQFARLSVSVSSKHIPLLPFIKQVFRKCLLCAVHKVITGWGLKKKNAMYCWRLALSSSNDTPSWLVTTRKDPCETEITFITVMGWPSLLSCFEKWAGNNYVCLQKETVRVY
jgi:hypothetical protein